MKNKKLKDLKIDVVEKKDGPEHPRVHHPVLPQHEFSMLIVAPKGSGKTNFICNLLLKHYKRYFHQVWVCSPTYKNDEKWDVVMNTKHILKENAKLEKVLNQKVKAERKAPKVVFGSAAEQVEEEAEAEEKFDGKIPAEDFFHDMNEIPIRLQKQDEIINILGEKGYSKHVADRILIICDDQAGLFRGGNNNNPIVNYVIKHRHVSTSCIIVTQAYKAVPKTIRTNCNSLILFEIPNLSELHAIYEENPEGLNEKEWTKVYKYATKDPYSFMYINNHFKKGERIYKNFDHKILIKTTKNDDDDEKALEQQSASESESEN